MNSLRMMKWLSAATLTLGFGGCLPIDQELEVLFAPEAVGNAELLFRSALFAVLQPLLF